jgi:uncharacterized membrane protein
LRAAAHFVACASLIALIFLSLAWELWLAPLRPGGSWLALKALPLLAPVFGALHGRIYTLQWALLLVPAYFAEGVVRAYSESGASVRFALVEAGLALVFFVAGLVYVRCAAQPQARR